MKTSLPHACPPCTVVLDFLVCMGSNSFFRRPLLQVFVKGEFIGGADILMNMHNEGELEKVLTPIIKQQRASK